MDKIHVTFIESEEVFYFKYNPETGETVLRVGGKPVSAEDLDDNDG